jgi:hypothetical protein
MPLQIGDLNGYPGGMATDPDSQAKGRPSRQPASAAPDVLSVLGLHSAKEPGWVIVWTLGTPDWAVIRHPDMPEDLRLRVRVAHTEEGFAVVAALIERDDGRALTARDLRRVKLPPPWALAADQMPRQPRSPRVTAPRPGRRGKGDDHWRAVFDLWVRAMRVAPHTPVRWMRTQWPGEPSDATMRRWAARARERAETNRWREDQQ